MEGKTDLIEDLEELLAKIEQTAITAQDRNEKRNAQLYAHELRMILAPIRDDPQLSEDDIREKRPHDRDTEDAIEFLTLMENKGCGVQRFAIDRRRPGDSPTMIVRFSAESDE